jgi:hypothetical protein
VSRDGWEGEQSSGSLDVKAEEPERKNLEDYHSSLKYHQDRKYEHGQARMVALRRCASMHQYFAEGEMPFMLVQMSKVIEMQFSRLTK